MPAAIAAPAAGGLPASGGSRSAADAAPVLHSVRGLAVPAAAAALQRQLHAHMHQGVAAWLFPRCRSSPQCLALRAGSARLCPRLAAFRRAPILAMAQAAGGRCCGLRLHGGVSTVVRPVRPSRRVCAGGRGADASGAFAAARCALGLRPSIVRPSVPWRMVLQGSMHVRRGPLYGLLCHGCGARELSHGVAFDPRVRSW